jgi:PhnB protein
MSELGIAQDQKISIAPMLSVRGGTRAIEFYKAAFGAGELFRIDSERPSARSLSAVDLCGW